jgi:hypothetical protein
MILRDTVVLLCLWQAAAAVHPHHERNVAGLLSRAPKKMLQKASTFNAPVNWPDFSNGVRISPTAFGGDPTGVKDSTVAIQTAVEHCVNQSVVSPNGVFPGSRSFGNGKSVRDMGGCVVDLEGGEYRISKPIVIPEYTANMQLGTGSIIGSETFPVDGFLIVVGNATAGACRVPQGSCNIDINFADLFLDAGNRGSCMQINHVMGVTVGPG